MSTQDLQPNDETLVHRVAQHHSVEAFELLYDRYSRAVYLLAMYMINSQEAEEMVQDIFMLLWNKAGQFDSSRGSFAAWFLTIARNHIRAELKQQNRHWQKIELDAVEQLLTNIPDDGQPSVEDRVGQDEQNAQLYDALRSLPPEQRRALIMAYFGGLSQSSIASELDLPVGTVKKRIYLAMKKLREFFSNEEQPDDNPVETEQSEKHYDRS
ncbi:MAG: sigma-70 family RNA polymerase sigma factor [Chloroflexi bacterium]|nr:sigma-70 family RNA polymerase sigma factor [Chloroflexota bacterium]